MTDDQVRDVRDLTRKAGIAPTITKLRTGDPLLTELAPGERTFVEPAVLAAPVQERPQGSRSPGRSPPAVAAPRAPTPAAPAVAVGRGGSGNGGRQGAGREAAGCRCRRVTRRRTSAPVRRGPVAARLDHGLHLDLGGAAAFSAGTRAGSGRGGR